MSPSPRLRPLVLLLFTLALALPVLPSRGALAQSRSGPVLDTLPTLIQERDSFDLLRTLAMAGGAVGAANLSLYLLNQPTTGIVLRWLGSRLYVIGAAYGGAMAALWLHDSLSPPQPGGPQRIEEMHVDRPMGDEIRS